MRNCLTVGKKAKQLLFVHRSAMQTSYFIPWLSVLLRPMMLVKALKLEVYTSKS